jgi:hypothetical protein
MTDIDTVRAEERVPSLPSFLRPRMSWPLHGTLALTALNIRAACVLRAISDRTNPWPGRWG